MQHHILGVIPARGGSKGVPGKNLLPLGGRPLVELAIRQSGKSGLLSRVIVSTEDEAIARAARAAGGDVPFMRPAELATDTAGTWQVMRHAFEWLRENQGFAADILVVLQPTTPFRTADHIDRTISAMLEAGASSAMTVREVDYPPQWMLLKDDADRLSRLLPAYPKISRRQDAVPVYQPNGLVFAVRREVLYNDPPLPCDDTLGVPMNGEDSVNIDEWWQYRYAQMIWQERHAGEAAPKVA